MKKFVCTLTIFALLLCSAALAEVKTVEPMYTEIDMAAPADGVYPVYFASDSIADSEIALSIYSEDIYDIVDISTLAVGDTFVFSGLDFKIESLERDSDLYVNGGMNNGGWTLRSYDEENCWKVVMEDDYPTWTHRGEATLPLAEDVTFSDGWEDAENPVITTGAEAVGKAIAESEMDYFSPMNVTVCVEDGKVVEIIRTPLAMLQQKVVEPIYTAIDLVEPEDGIYTVAFEPANLHDGVLGLSILTEDCYDILDIATLDVGDVIMIGGLDYMVESLERGDSLLINGGLDNGGWTLWSYDEDNCWKVAIENDYPTWTGRGVTDLVLSDEVTFTDGWDIEKDPVTVTGEQAVAKAIAETGMDYFGPENTTIRTEGGKIVEINRYYMP